MKGQTLRRLVPDARQAFELIYQLRDWFGVIKHK
jgi:hypothetical protein